VPDKRRSRASAVGQRDALRKMVFAPDAFEAPRRAGSFAAILIPSISASN
jgi:hypothetical protein